MSAAAALFPSLDPKALIWDYPLTFLHQCEKLYAARNGWECVKESGADSDFVRRWELTTGRKWQP